jgi:hypothetical protein
LLAEAGVTGGSTLVLLRFVCVLEGAPGKIPGCRSIISYVDCHKLKSGNATGKSPNWKMRELCAFFILFKYENISNLKTSLLL